MTALGDKMLNAAVKADLQEDHPLVVAALKFNDAAEGFYGTPQTVDVKTFMGCWARARRLWSEYSKEPLL
jgi:hypothetical protein